MVKTLIQIKNFGARYIDYSAAWKAALALGTIVWCINLSHGAIAALPAALKQACYTFFVAGFIIRLCERIASTPSPAFISLTGATVVPSLIAIGLTFLVHSLRGTPEPFYSTVPTMILAPVSFFAWGYQSRKSFQAGESGTVSNH